MKSGIFPNIIKPNLSSREMDPSSHELRQELADFVACFKGHLREFGRILPEALRHTGEGWFKVGDNRGGRYMYIEG